MHRAHAAARLLVFGVPTEVIDGVRWRDLFVKNLTVHTSVNPDFDVDFPLAMQWIAEHRTGPIDKYGWTYYFVSIGLMILLHDAYFSWTHRVMHHRRLFKLFHRAHHLSTSPTPWAAYSFSPLEAFVQGGIGLVIALVIPIHPSAFLPFMLWQITFNVLGHCGYEIFPNSFLRSPVGKFLNSPTHHALHHEKFKSNYSLYFNVWDRWCGTNHATYGERFDRATSGGRSPMPLAVTIEPALCNAVPDSAPTSGVLSPDAATLPIS